MPARVRALRKLVSSSSYVIDEYAVADAILAHEQIRLIVEHADVQQELARLTARPLSTVDPMSR
jgi:hypothetical protein